MPKGYLTPRDRAYNKEYMGSINSAAAVSQTRQAEKKLIEQGQLEDIKRKSGKLTSKVAKPDRLATAKGNLRAIKLRLTGGAAVAEPAKKAITDPTLRQSKNVIQREPESKSRAAITQLRRDYDDERSRSHKPRNKHIIPVGDRSYEPPRPKPRPKKRSD